MVICFSMHRGVHFFGKITLKNFASSFPGTCAALFSLIFLHLSSSFFIFLHLSSSFFIFLRQRNSNKTGVIIPSKNSDEQRWTVNCCHIGPFLLFSLDKLYQTIVYINTIKYIMIISQYCIYTSIKLSKPFPWNQPPKQIGGSHDSFRKVPWRCPCPRANSTLLCRRFGDLSMSYP